MLLKISELYKKRLPGLPVSRQTIIRFITRGVVVRDKANKPKRVFLEGARVGRAYYTTEKAWYDFIYECSNKKVKCHEDSRDSSGTGEHDSGGDTVAGGQEEYDVGAEVVCEGVRD